jgi:quercetin dioxygenase-like cupin family protein
MAKFTSRFPELGFYVNGEHHKFHVGEYVTENADEIKVLKQLADTVRIDEPKAEEAPKPKAPKKSSGK